MSGGLFSKFKGSMKLDEIHFFSLCSLVHFKVACKPPGFVFSIFVFLLKVLAELKDLADEIALAELVSPTLIIIGKVVSLSPFWPQSSKEALALVEAR
ncbi:hypothetical protein RHMOL_Rhmol10G0080200 [Rhododendron molle]|uniref:Uncharacterized protein n=1 Tax=Rhododendron molle TaxID=49168 RepID=A0ACC0M138_RHOML|nr:hypothetical protein RHMOL_Rhmol10G0080200 [Rhododendron molle]